MSNQLPQFKTKIIFNYSFDTFHFYMRASTVYMTKEYGGSLELPDDVGNFPGLFGIKRCYQQEGEKESTSDLFVATETPQPQLQQPQSVDALRQSSIPGWIVFYLLVFSWIFYEGLIQKLPDCEIQPSSSRVYLDL